MEKKILHKAATRGFADHGWLKSYQTFSFSGYYNPDRIQFGALRVLNDDTVDGGRGFGDHPHDNMEIISIPLEGELTHRDSMNNVAVIQPGEIQVMSAGTGIFHTENNSKENEPVKFLQIWIFPNKRNVEPRYQQIRIDNDDKRNAFQQILSPDKNDAGVWIYQDAWFNLGNFDKGVSTEYTIKKKGNGAYIFMIKGDAEAGGTVLNERDGVGITGTDKISMKALSDAKILVMDVPMMVS
jgi:redox-sensitive bicupin YhaK (pirin superfamily)